MNALIESLRALVTRVNAQELQARRAYHASLQASGNHNESLDEHFERYASLAQLGPPATEHDIARLQALCPVPLPAGLLTFYRDLGGFRGGRRLQDAVIHTPSHLLRASERPAGPWEALPSMGLVHMMKWAYGNDRFEFGADSGEGLDQAGIDALNNHYAIIGWRVLDEGEAHEFLYFDQQGYFGTLFYHQDAFDELLADELAPMVQATRPAAGTFDAVLAAFVAAVARPA